MGNRAIVKPEGKDIGVYLHWNGGIDSVTAFLKYCELKQYRGFDDEYGIARFTQVVGNFFGGGLVAVGIAYLTVTAFKNGSNAFEIAEFNTLKDLDLFKEGKVG